jgi:ATP-dependent DNA helicase RecG
VETVRGEAFIRLGQSKHRLSEEEKHEIRINKHQIELEAEPCNLTYPDDFDSDLINEYVTNFKADRKLDERLSEVEILELRHLGAIKSAQFQPNIACAILFAKDPGKIIPGARLRFLRFEGNEEGTGAKFNAIRDEWLEGPAPRLILEAEKVIESQVRNFSPKNTIGAE